MVMRLMAAIAEVLGAACIIVGLWAIRWEIGAIVAGVGLIVFGLALERRLNVHEIYQEESGNARAQGSA